MTVNIDVMVRIDLAHAARLLSPIQLFALMEGLALIVSATERGREGKPI